MNEHGIEELIGTLYEMVQDARSVPFSSDKCAVEREKVLDLLDEISNQLPGELKQAKTIVDSRSELITNAKREAENIMKSARDSPPAACRACTSRRSGPSDNSGRAVPCRCRAGISWSSPAGGTSYAGRR